ncbi:hypothetical protein FQN49_007534 [Arthroderma sp. PD_2]|nr:hypothetical protein FQN49_007534 [Arthroderma sp. PD_2]
MAGCIYKRISFDGPPEIFVGCPGGLIDGEKPDFVDDLEEDSDLYQEIMEESEWNSTELIPPEPGLFTPPEEVSPEVDAKNSLSGRETVDLQRDYEKTGLQVIVKLSNIHLTPEKPSYEGGSWHAEGQLVFSQNESSHNIVRYDINGLTNITESRLAYRHIGDSSDLDDIEYEEEDHYWLEEIFGCEEHGPSMQEIGNVACKEGRLLTFPNILQHRVEPFNLKIPTKPGHLKILALFLVDPNLRIISTANVPSQRADWRAESVSWGGVLEKLPRELFDEVLSHLDDFPMSMEEAKELRLELMEERKASMVHQENAISRRHFFLREPE